jgi:hypothetical protein
MCPRGGWLQGALSIINKLLRTTFYVWSSTALPGTDSWDGPWVPNAGWTSDDIRMCETSTGRAPAVSNQQGEFQLLVSTWRSGLHSFDAVLVDNAAVSWAWRTLGGDVGNLFRAYRRLMSDGMYGRVIHLVVRHLETDIMRLIL